MNNSAKPNSEDEPPRPEGETLIAALSQFNQLYPTEEHCVEELFIRLGVHCWNCQSPDMSQDFGQRKRTCQSCKKDVRITAGTFFENIRKARLWVAAIWLRERGVPFNAKQFADAIDAYYSTCWEILNKIAVVIASCMENESSSIAVSSAFFAPAVCKRSLETPANQHPFAEQAELEKRLSSSESTTPDTQAGNSDTAAQAPDTIIATGELISDSPASGAALSEESEEIYKKLSSKPVHFETLCQETGLTAQLLASTLTIMELDGLVERLAGDLYVQAKRPDKQCLPLDLSSMSWHASVEAGIEFIRANYHGISRKYLQLYLASYWCSVDRARWSSGALFKACGRFRGIKRADILAFVSPLLVGLVPWPPTPA